MAHVRHLFRFQAAEASVLVHSGKINVLQSSLLFRLNGLIPRHITAQIQVSLQTLTTD